MATTRIIPMHINKGKTIAQCMKARIDYVKNPDKTEDGEFISSYACAPESADHEFLMARDEYLSRIRSGRKNEVIAYQLRQSFKPGDVSAEEANQIGYELAERLLRGEHAFIVATHTDRQHIQDEVCQGFFGEFYLVVYGALRRLNMRTGAVCFGQDGLISVSCWAAC